MKAEDLNRLRHTQFRQSPRGKKAQGVLSNHERSVARGTGAVPRDEVVLRREK